MHSPDGFHVVSENLRSSGNDQLKILLGALEIAHKDFHGHLRAQFMDTVNGFGPDCRSTIGQIISIHGCDDDMLEGDFGEEFSDPTGFIKIGLAGAASLDVAESTGSRAGVPQNHDGGRPTAPAFSDIWTGSLLADRMESMGIDQGLGFTKSVAPRSFGTNPIRFSAYGKLMRGLRLVVEDH